MPLDSLAEAEKRWPIDESDFDFAQTHALLQSGFRQGVEWAEKELDKGQVGK